MEDKYSFLRKVIENAGGYSTGVGAVSTGAGMGLGGFIPTIIGGVASKVDINKTETVNDEDEKKDDKK